MPNNYEEINTNGDKILITKKGLANLQRHVTPGCFEGVVVFPKASEKHTKFVDSLSIRSTTACEFMHSIIQAVFASYIKENYMDKAIIDARACSFSPNIIMMTSFESMEKHPSVIYYHSASIIKDTESVMSRAANLIADWIGRSYGVRCVVHNYDIYSLSLAFAFPEISSRKIIYNFAFNRSSKDHAMMICTSKIGPQFDLMDKFFGIKSE